MMIGVAFDCETNGFDPASSRITEIGAIVFDATTLQEMARFRTLVWDESYPPQPAEILDVTGITDEMLRQEGMPFAEASKSLHEVIAMYGGASFFMAHNAPFDRRFFLAELARMNELPEAVQQLYAGLKWVCTWKDIEHPAKFKSKKLSHLALDYGVAVDPKTLHRADADCALMLDMVRAAGVSLEAVLERSQVPDVIVRAMVPSPFGAGNDGGAGKEKAKTLGYGWQKAHGTDGPTIKNAWLKKVKKDEVEKEKEKLGYQVVIVEG